MDNDKKLPQFGSLPKKAISWRAIAGGLTTVFAILLLLNLIGIAVGFSTIEPTEEGNALSGVGTGAIIWWILSNLIAIFIGARVAARVGVSFSNKGGVMQGFLTWALYCILSYLVVFSAVGNVISGVGSIITKTAVEVGNSLVSQNTSTDNQDVEVGDVNWQEAKSEFYALLRDTEKEALDPQRLESQAEDLANATEDQAVQAVKDPTTLDEEVDKVFQKAENEFANSLDALDKEALTNVIVNRSNLSKEEASNMVDNYVESYEEVVDDAQVYLKKTKEEVVDQTEDAAQGIAKAALYVSIALILGVIVAVLGGLNGVSSLRKEYKDQLGNDY
ncbi:hypothetical protein [Nonlabens marinus]|uniref:Uncharacterized protein n=1 Tax=Nonlabens marinus S1-08 TaxID=1454201 RepID=W8VWK2_9FLAO|nr:hypothetical protein [Nonlabens marinus]BAO56413.1 hypothetical protein NMS_2404 [Nonlabens marinus S1-08]